MSWRDFGKVLIGTRSVKDAFINIFFVICVIGSLLIYLHIKPIQNYLEAGNPNNSLTFNQM